MSRNGREANEVEVTNDSDVVRVRQTVRQLAADAGLSLVDQTKVITAASELARNTLVYGGGGRVVVSIANRDTRLGVRAEFIDEGPGIADLDKALEDGWTSGNGLGLGLSGSRRLVDEFDIRSEVGKGTHITIVKWGR